ncbi:S26 family signal peptidase [Actinokineospora sp. NBRC 105648]|uniref:S26 family signal peptidase n=1 Tax=Actinokineospora sp. NBRC 105648 TaxID=3032206 RepID=UPI002555A7C4|nr:S26 family signal peptidase [Actinokineospora sp. NBRC 105648]
MNAGRPLGGMPVRRVVVRGPSMSPALADGDTVLASRGVPRVGDIVLVTWDARPGQLSVKRAVRPVGGGWHVEGDNRFGSTDSRTLGPARVHAVVRWRLWPRPRRLQGLRQGPKAL